MKNLYTDLAKQAVETYLRTGEILQPPEDLPKNFLTQRAGAFVTIYKGKNKELRGCIGTYLPARDNIAEEIIYNAIAAATKDWRFRPITEDEFSELSYSVYILEEPEQIKDIEELDPKKYGILIKTESGKSGLLLPDLEGLDTPEKQFEAVCKKAGIFNPDQEEITLYRFRAKKFE